MLRAAFKLALRQIEGLMTSVLSLQAAPGRCNYVALFAAINAMIGPHMPEKFPIMLPDDIEQRLLDGQRSRATRDLVERRGITLNEARELIERWLFDWRQGNREAELPPGC
jgi:hypothetical protein